MRVNTLNWFLTLVAAALIGVIWLFCTGCSGYVSHDDRVTPEEVYQATIDAWYGQDGGVGEANYREWVVSYVDPQQLVWSFDERIAHVFIPSHGPCVIYVANDLSPEGECRALAFGFGVCLEAPQAEAFCDAAY